jgi:hypothetical protein
MEKKDLPKQVNVRFLGDNFWKGIPKSRHITVGNHKLWNHLRFPKDQQGDGSYNFPMEFYQEHRAIFDDKQKFIVKLVAEDGEVLDQEASLIQPEFELITPDLSEKGVIEVDGQLYCPKCVEFSTTSAPQMEVHLLSHEAE